MKRRSGLRFALEGLEGVVLLPASVVSWPLLGSVLVNWGSRREERERRWPGDDLIAARVRATTRAITIAAPAETIWQYLVQFGLDRAGFYSYELLERLGGFPVTNVESVEPDWQSLAVGDEVLLHPEGGIRLSSMSAGRALCFGKRTLEGKDVADISWSFYVEPEAEGRCRLVVRGCFGPPADGSLARRLARGLEAALDFVMEQRMLRTLKRLAEGAPRSPGELL